MTASGDRGPVGPEAARRRLDSWKAIAAYLGRDVRTIQRWERHEGLPVRRLQHGVRGSVYAFVDELDGWRARRTALPPAGVDGAEAAPASRPGWYRRHIALGAVAMAAVGTVGAAMWRFAAAPQRVVPLSPGPSISRVFAAASTEGARPLLVPVPASPVAIVLTPSGDTAYVASYESKVISAIDRAARKVVRAWPLDCRPQALAVASEGTTVYAGCLEGDIRVVRAGEPRVELIKVGGPAHDLLLTPDGRSLFVAMSHAGLRRVRLDSGEVDPLPSTGCPMSLAAHGSRLYVSCQCEGPGGRPGHDAIDIFDVETLRPAGRIQGPPLVGGPIAVSPDGAFLWANGNDACFGPDYDHEGCPKVPGRVMQIFRTADGALARSIGFDLSEEVGRAWFLPGFESPVIAGRPARVIRSGSYSESERAPFEGVSAVAAARGRGEVWAALTAQRAVAILPLVPAAGDLPREGLVNHWRGDGTAADSADGRHGRRGGNAGFAPGVSGMAFSLGDLGSVSFGSRENIDSANPRAGLTVSAWIKPAAIDRDAWILDRMEIAPGGARGWRLALLVDGRVAFCAGESRGVPCRAGAPGTILSTRRATANEWTHVAATRHGLDVAIYVNGALDASTRIPDVGGCEFCDLRIGSAVPGPSFRGLIDEIALYDRALDAAGIARLAARPAITGA